MAKGEDATEATGLSPIYLAALDVLAKPWTGQLLVVLEEGPLRFSEIPDRLPAIGDRALAARLKELEERGLVTRRVEAGPPVRVFYELTDVGRSFRKVAAAARDWGRLLMRHAGAGRTPRPGAHGSSRPQRPRRAH